MKRKTIAEHARDVLVERSEFGVMWGDGLLDYIAERAGVRTKISHPLNRWQAVLAGLERAPHIFEKYYVMIHTTHNRPVDVRSFRLKEAAA